MKRNFMVSSLFVLLLGLLPAEVLLAFTKDGCGDGECRSCHQLTKKDAALLLTVEEKDILDLKMSEVPGLWEIDLQQREKVVPLFIDFSKQYLISGSVVKIADRQDITRERFIDLNRVEVSRIPLNDALVVGSPKAEIKIIVLLEKNADKTQAIK